MTTTTSGVTDDLEQLLREVLSAEGEAIDTAGLCLLVEAPVDRPDGRVDRVLAQQPSGTRSVRLLPDAGELGGGEVLHQATILDPAHGAAGPAFRHRHIHGTSEHKHVPY